MEINPLIFYLRVV